MSTEYESTPNDHPDHEKGAVARRGAIALAAGGITAAAIAVVGAAGGGHVASGAGPSPAHRAAPTARRQETPSEADLAIGALAASLEVLAVSTYQAALDAATGGALGDVPPAVAEYVTTARNQHQQQLDAWNGVLTSAGKPAVSAPPADLAAAVNAQFGQVTNVAGAAQLALMLEQVAADTYLFAIGQLVSPAAIELAGSIFTVDRQHQSVLLFALGMYPVPQTFATTEMAYSGSGPMPGQMMAPSTK